MRGVLGGKGRPEAGGCGGFLEPVTPGQKGDVFYGSPLYLLRGAGPLPPTRTVTDYIP